ncbi:leucine-rich repeat domain-containing protein [Dyella sp. C9]|uniref:leucine-rich repeat domain-containing protein n=1 Tax=Dyella sp. C9 TaxID=2202154 RepID=UPI000DF00B4D|nr:leucine-rich repeat domain-containing protein [Dyella sp. C9]
METDFAAITRAGVQLLAGRDGIQFVMPAGDDYQACIDFIRQMASDQLILWLRAMPGRDAVGELLGCSGVEDIRRIHLQTKGLQAPTRLSVLHQLRTLSADSAVAFDFSGMVELEELGGVWSEQWTGLEYCSALRSLHVSAFRRKTLEGLPRLANLASLTLIQTSLVSCQGMEAATELEELSVSYARGLRDITALASLPRLRRVEFESCRNIVQPEVLGSLPALEFLLLKRFGSLPSLSFIEGNKRLHGLALIDSKPADMDLGVCLRHPTLRRLGATGFKGAMPPVAEVERQLEARLSHEHDA